MKSLVGYTGFVGSNIYNGATFENCYNSKNITSAFNTNPDLLVYSGVPAEKFLANKDPEADLKIIQNATENIKKINPKAIVLISTIDVYKNPVDVNEDTEILTEDLQPYGLNRSYLENWVKENFEKRLIVRLPGLYGKNIKKNFIYDLIHRIPSMLTEEKISEIYKTNKVIFEYYTNQNNGFFKLKELSKIEREKLRAYFCESGFSAVNFTDSRSQFQFYNLEYLWEHINLALNNDVKILNLATEPILISELYNHIENKTFKNELNKPVANYDFKTKHDQLFSGENGYIFNKAFVMEDIKKYVKNYEVL